jgi:hypothetical protein
MEHGSVAGLGVDGELPAVGGGQRRRDGQAEPGAAASVRADAPPMTKRSELIRHLIHHCSGRELGRRAKQAAIGSREATRGPGPVSQTL